MKHLLILLMLPFTFSGGAEQAKLGEYQELETSKVEEKVKEKDQTDYLLEALIQVESRGNANAIGDKHLGEPSIGVLQIRPVMVREVNRILKIMGTTQRYKLKDRFDRQKSIEMFLFWKNYHHPEDGFEEIARCWNGGPRGLKNKRTEKYWIKVQNEINNLKIK